MSDAPEHPRSGTAARRRRPPWWAWVLLGLVTIVGTVVALGGFNDVPVQKLPIIKLGQREVGNELTLTVTGSYLSDVAPVTGYDLDEGTVDLVVEATALNTTARPTVFASDAVRVLLDGVIDPSKDGPDSVIELRSGKSLSFLQPGLPTKIAYLWPVPEADVAAGDPLVVGIFQRHPDHDNPLFNDAQSAAQPVVRIVTTVGAG